MNIAWEKDWGKTPDGTAYILARYYQVEGGRKCLDYIKLYFWLPNETYGTQIGKLFDSAREAKKAAEKHAEENK